MRIRQSRSTFLKHNLVFLFLLLGVITLVTTYIVATSRQIERISTQSTQKSQLIEDMNRIVRERSLTMYAIYFQDDAFKQDEEHMKFNQLAVDFILKREQYLALQPDKEELALFSGALRLIRTTAPLQQDIVNRLISGQKKNILEYLVQKDLPLEEKIISIFDDLLSMQRKHSRLYLQKIHRENLYVSVGFLLTLILVFILSFVNSRRALSKIQRAESQLTQEKELAENTLATVTETILTTDTEGRVIGINNAGLAILNQSTSQVLGKSIADLIPIITCEQQGPVSIDHSLLQLDGPLCLLPKSLCMKIGKQQSVVEITVFPIGNPGQGMKQLTYILRDVTYQHEVESEITWAAEHDPLTGCYNRRGFERILQRTFVNREAHAKPHALFYIDLDRFKNINDQYGHAAGDVLLQNISRIFQDKIRDTDSLARIGGDEFCILLQNCDPDSARQIADALLDSVINFQFTWKGKAHSVGASIGIMSITQQENIYSISRLINAADKACYLAKHSGGNQYRITDSTRI